MPKKKLALILFGSMLVILAIHFIVLIMLTGAHKPYMVLVAGLAGTIPGFVVASLAWRGWLPNACKPTSN
jgi:hypothetical protein